MPGIAVKAISKLDLTADVKRLITQANDWPFETTICGLAAQTDKAAKKYWSSANSCRLAAKGF